MSKLYTIFTHKELSLIYTNAKKMEIGGKSYIRGNDRMQTLAGDQFVSQCGELALSKYITGNIDLYIQTRNVRNLNPTNGDNGMDLLGYNIDIKAGRMRRGIDFLYHLWVRPKEYHPDRCYVLALMHKDRNDIIYLIGWMPGNKLTWDGERYAASMDILYPLPKPGTIEYLRWIELWRSNHGNQN